MTRAEMVCKVAETTGLTTGEANNVLQVVFDEIAKELREGNSVKLSGFGTFKTRERKARLLKCPRNNEWMHISARRIPVFQAGRILKNKVDEGREGEKIYE